MRMGRFAKRPYEELQFRRQPRLREQQAKNEGGNLVIHLVIEPKALNVGKFGRGDDGRGRDDKW